eukprot:gene37570-48112_t
MQNDFVPKDAVNPDGGRFAVPEGAQAAQHCSALMHAFADAGGVVVATRDYHPHDHCSFSGHGGHFPAHCVQGERVNDRASCIVGWR